MPWVAQVQVSKRWPDTLEVLILEHRPAAFWGDDQLLSEQGVLGFWFLSCPTAFRIAPPLVISEAQVREACEVILRALDAATT